MHWRGLPNLMPAGSQKIGRRLALPTTLLIAAIVFADALVIGGQRDASIEDFRTAATNLANGMAAQTSRSLTAVDSALQEVASMLAMLPDTGAEQLRGKASLELLDSRQQRLAMTDDLALVDAEGRLASSTRAQPEIGQDLSGQDFFRYFRDHDEPGGFVGLPRQDGQTGRWTSVLARRINDRRGHFAGVVLADLSLDKLEDFYRTAMPIRRTVTILRRDGAMILRYPMQPGALGRKIPEDAPWYGIVAAGGGSYLAPDYFDGVPSLAVVRPLPDLPLFIEASVTEADVLAGWYGQRSWLMASGLTACLVVVVLVRLFAAQLHRLAERNGQLDEARRQLAVALSNISQGLCFFDGNQRLVLCNQRFGEIYGIPASVLRPGALFADIIGSCHAASGLANVTPDQFVETCASIVSSGKQTQTIIEMLDGRTIAVHQQPMRDGGWVATHEDITERRRAEEHIAFLARHDALTGLPNRSLLLERIGRARVHAGRGASYAVLFLDLDRFKSVNDTLGHAAGDELLRMVAARLLVTVRDGDTVARLGGDEFVVLQATLQTPDSAAVLAERIIKTLGAPYKIGGHDVLIGVSVGIDVATSDRILPEDLLKNADMALYTAKGAGRGTFRFFETDMDTDVHNRQNLERDLRHAIDRGEFELHYQPIVNVVSGLVCGFEALLRWNHPVRGLVWPHEFIGLAEECGLIIPIGAWLLGQACREIAEFPDDIRVAVNLSPVQFRAANFVDIVRDALATSGLAPSRLELEITESVLLQSNERNLTVMNQLQASGIRVVMDDFGVGYSSLSYLRRFRFGRIKIDPSFIKDISTNDEAVYVVRAILGLCRDLGIRTTAEGVETADQLAILVAEGCSELQGYLFSRPRPASHIAELIGVPLIFEQA